MTTTTTKKLSLAVAGTALAAGLVLAPAAAFAHVGVDAADEPVAGQSTTLSFGFSHGCDGSPTTQIAVSMPEGLSGVHPIADAGWSIDVERGGDAGRVSTVTYTAIEPIPDELRGEVAMQVGFADDASGELVFPVEQSCESGSTSWSEVAEPGQDPHDLDAPAPTLEMVTPTPSEEPAASEAGDGVEPWTIVSAGVNVLAIGVAAVALTIAVRSARRR